MSTGSMFPLAKRLTSSRRFAKISLNSGQPKWRSQL